MASCLEALELSHKVSLAPVWQAFSVGFRSLWKSFPAHVSGIHICVVSSSTPLTWKWELGVIIIIWAQQCQPGTQPSLQTCWQVTHLQIKSSLKSLTCRSSLKSSDLQVQVMSRVTPVNSKSSTKSPGFTKRDDCCGLSAVILAGNLGRCCSATV